MAQSIEDIKKAYGDAGMSDEKAKQVAEINAIIKQFSERQRLCKLIAENSISCVRAN